VDRTAHRRAAVGRGALAIALAALLVAFVAEPFGVPTASMAPTVRPGDHVIVDKLAYRFGDPRRGDLIVFHAPGSGELMLKRVVALGGDRVAIEDGVVKIDWRAVREPFVDRRLVDSVYFGPVRVSAGAVFVMGDRRSDSLDSRTFGAVPRGRIVGRVDLRIWPPAGVGSVVAGARSH
jgi:signal peptidase I